MGWAYQIRPTLDIMKYSQHNVVLKDGYFSQNCQFSSTACRYCDNVFYK